ncbi:MAG: rhomboid family intramembrane serine protease, partial [Pseudomonadota bacterium]
MIYQNLTAAQINQYGLILTSQGISFHAQKAGRSWNILVDRDNTEKATKIIEEYFSEHPAAHNAGEDRHDPHTYTGLWISAVMISVHIAIILSNEGRVFRDAFQMSAAKIMAGEYYRTITALFLHADTGHLAGNVIGISIFGTVLCRMTGWGPGMLMILLSGGMGNLINAFLFSSNHVSIGSSTAVFGTIGMLSGKMFVEKFRRTGIKQASWLPIGGGIALLSFLGSGEHTDVTAHLFGMIVGIFLGMMVSHWKKYVQRPDCQLLS